MDNLTYAESEQDLFEAVLCGIFRFSINEEAEILQFNSAGASIYGYDSKEAFAEVTAHGLFGLIYEYDIEIVKRFIRRCVQTGQPVNFGHRILRKDKTITYIMGEFSVIRMKDGSREIQSVFMDSGNRVVQADIRKSIFYKPSEAKKNARKIIIADEDETGRAEARNILCPDYALIEAKSAQEVLSILQKEKDEIAVILSSFSIMVQDNFGFVAAIKSSMQYASIPIVALGDNEDNDINEEEVLAYGANEYLKRPLNPHIIKLRLANLMELRDTAIQRNAVETIVDNIPGGVMVVRVSDKLQPIFVSSGIAELGGWEEEELSRVMGRDIIDTVISEKDQSRIKAKITNALPARLPVEFTARALHKNGSTIWIHAHAVWVREENGFQIYQVVVSPTTVTEKMYQGMMDDAPWPISVFSMENNELLYVNNAAGKLMEDTPELNNYLEQLTFDEYKMRQIIPQNSSKHLTLNGKLIDWNGIKSRIIYITDDTESYFAQMERHELYETELIKQSVREENVIGTAVFNLSRDFLVEFNTEKVFNRSVVEGMKVKECLDLLLEYMVDPQERAEFVKRFQVAKMIEAFHKNNRKNSIRCRYQDRGKMLHWIHFKWNIIERPMDGDILAFMYVYDIDEEIIRQTAYSRTLGMEAEVVSYLKLLDGTIHPLMTKENTLYVPEFTTGNYEEYVAMLLENVIDAADRKKAAGEFEMESLRRSLEKEDIVSIYYRTRWYAKKGVRRQQHKKVQAFYLDEEQQLICMVYTDVTDIYEEQQEQNRKLQVALNEAKQANEAKSMFLSRMSHEIRTPMNAILGLSGLAIDETKDPAAMKEYLNKINSSGQYLLGLINDILDMSKIESERVKLSPEPYTIKECIDFIMISMKSQMDEKGLHFSYQEENVTKEKLMLDKMRFQQIFFNLLSNAVKFTGWGGHIGVFVTQLWKKEDHVKVHIIVKDDGKGIAEDSMQQIFEPFEQAKNQNSIEYGGTGLGLAIVKNLVNLMDGTISVKSTEGKGTEFILDMLLPVGGLQEQEVKAQQTLLQDYDFTGKKVLLVEDHKINMEIVQKLLTRKNCMVDTAQNGQKAVDIMTAAGEKEYQAILMDVRMPVMDGITATKLIRRLPRPDAGTIPIIAMTANAFDEDALETKLAGMNAHLTKPISMNVLYQTLYEFM
ncbi:MAG: ATP-binding protein [Lachnospiraceae bacterium]|nr:ATP-binding protein [Lachnospiraceae bacterium]